MLSYLFKLPQQIQTFPFSVTKLGFHKSRFDSHSRTKKKMSIEAFSQIRVDSDDNLHKNTAHESLPLCSRVYSSSPIVPKSHLSYLTSLDVK